MESAGQMAVVCDCWPGLKVLTQCDLADDEGVQLPHLAPSTATEPARSGVGPDRSPLRVNCRKGTNSAHAFSHNRTIAGYSCPTPR